MTDRELDVFRVDHALPKVISFLADQVFGRLLEIKAIERQVILADFRFGRLHKTCHRAHDGVGRDDVVNP